MSEEEAWEAAEGVVLRLQESGELCGWPDENDVRTVVLMLHNARLMDLTPFVPCEGSSEAVHAEASSVSQEGAGK